MKAGVGGGMPQPGACIYPPCSHAWLWGSLVGSAQLVKSVQPISVSSKFPGPWY